MEVNNCHVINGPSTPSSEMKCLIDKCNETCKELRLNINAVTSDMGSNNWAMWKEFNVNVSRYSRNAAYSIGNKDIMSLQMFHICLRICSATLSRPLEIPAKICESQGFPTKIVSSWYIKNLWIKENRNWYQFMVITSHKYKLPVSVSL